jgi:hypothetical protein
MGAECRTVQRLEPAARSNEEVIPTRAGPLRELLGVRRS